MAVTELSDPYSCTYSYGRICHNISHITIIANTLATPEATNTKNLVSFPDPNNPSVDHFQYLARGRRYHGLQVLCQRTELENLKMSNQN